MPEMDEPEEVGPKYRANLDEAKAILDETGLIRREFSDNPNDYTSRWKSGRGEPVIIGYNRDTQIKGADEEQFFKALEAVGRKGLIDNYSSDERNWKHGRVIATPNYSHDIEDIEEFVEDTELDAEPVIDVLNRNVSGEE